MNPLAQMMLRMSPQMQQQAPDYAMPGPAPDMATAYGQLAAQQAIPKMPMAQRPQTDQELYDFVQEMAGMRNMLPPPLRLKLDKLLMTIGGGMPQEGPPAGY